MNKSSRLKSAIAKYTYNGAVYAIPLDYYDRMATTWTRANNSGLKWDRYQAAATLLLSVYLSGFIGKNQINPEGIKAMDWANQVRQEADIKPN